MRIVAAILQLVGVAAVAVALGWIGAVGLVVVAGGLLLERRGG